MKTNCSICGKQFIDSKIITELNLEIYPRYVREDGELEDMNGLWRKTSEFFCDDCFQKYTDVLQNFYQENAKNINSKKDSDH